MGVNVGVKLNKTQYDIYMLLTTDPYMTYNKLSNILSKSEETIRRNKKVLVNYNLVERCGSDKTGYWNIIYKSFYH